MADCQRDQDIKQPFHHIFNWKSERFVKRENDPYLCTFCSSCTAIQDIFLVSVWRIPAYHLGCTTAMETPVGLSVGAKQSAAAGASW